MRNDRQAILSLIAMGRITPVEAERLLAVWQEGRDAFWAVAACLAVALITQSFPGHLLSDFLHSVRTLLPGLMAAAQHTQLIVTDLLGGRL